MGSGRWRIVVAILGGTGWGWTLVLPKLRDISVNPAIHPSWLWVSLLAVCVVLLLIDVAAIWYWFAGTDEPSDVYRTDDEPAGDRSPGGPGRRSSG